MRSLRKPVTRSFLGLLLAVLLAPVSAQPWPSRPIAVVTPFAAGSGPDLALRPLFELVAARIGQPIVQETRAGAGGTVAMQIGAQAAADGHTLIVVTNGNLIEYHVRPRTTRDPLELAPVTRIGSAASGLVVAATSPFRTLDDLVAAAKSSPGKLNYGSAGVASPSHLQAVVLLKLTDTRMVHVPYGVVSDLIPAVLRGDVAFGFHAIAFVAPQVQAGKLRLLASTSERRLRQFPDVPTLFERFRNPLGVQENWLGLVLPAGTPAPIGRRLHAELVAGLGDASVRKALEVIASEAAPSESPEEFRRFLRLESDKWHELVRSSGITPD